MKILVLNYEYPPLGGGAGVTTKYISEELVLIGHEVTVISTWYEGLKQIEENGNLKIIRLKSKRKFTFRSDIFEMHSWIRSSKRFLSKYCNENNFTICLANFALPGGEVAFYLKKKFDIPFSIISHGHDIPWFFGKEMFWYHFLTYPWIKKICKNSVLNFIMTESMKINIDKFLGYTNEVKNIIIPNGCDTKTFIPDYSKRCIQFKIIFACRLVDQKDPFTFLNALKLLSTADIPYIADIIGDGVHRGTMEKFVHDNSLQEQVRFTGWISKDKILEEYQSSHVFVQSSLYEAMSMAVMEALSCGNYVICTDVGLNRDLIIPGENGELFPISNSIELYNKIKSYYDNKFQENFIVNEGILEKLRSNYNWRNIVQKYEYYLKIASDNSLQS